MKKIIAAFFCIFCLMNLFAQNKSLANCRCGKPNPDHSGDSLSKLIAKRTLRINRLTNEYDSLRSIPGHLPYLGFQDSKGLIVPPDSSMRDLVFKKEYTVTKERLELENANHTSEFYLLKWFESKISELDQTLLTYARDSSSMKYDSTGKYMLLYNDFIWQSDETAPHNHMDIKHHQYYLGDPSVISGAEILKKMQLFNFPQFVWPYNLNVNSNSEDSTSRYDYSNFKTNKEIIYYNYGNDYMKICVEETDYHGATYSSYENVYYYKKCK